MRTAEHWAAAIKRVGGTAVRLGSGKSFPAAVQPRRDGDSEPGHGPLGGGITPRYTLYAPWDAEGAALAEGEELEYQGKRYLVLRTETMYLSGAPVYRWAVLRRATARDEQEEKEGSGWRR